MSDGARDELVIGLSAQDAGVALLGLIALVVGTVLAVAALTHLTRGDR